MTPLSRGTPFTNMPNGWGNSYASSGISSMRRTRRRVDRIRQLDYIGSARRSALTRGGGRATNVGDVVSRVGTSTGGAYLCRDLAAMVDTVGCHLGEDVFHRRRELVTRAVLVDDRLL